MLSDVEARALLQEASTEWENGRMAYRGVVAFGQKPPG
jgi:hypothetical protein